jgi:hypothetical protein
MALPVRAVSSRWQNCSLAALSGLSAVLLSARDSYFGPLRIPPEHLFTVTNWMILLRAAGMASQAADFLVQANLLRHWEQLWDTSAILTEKAFWDGCCTHWSATSRGRWDSSFSFI